KDTALGSILDYLPNDAVFILCEPDALEEHAEAYITQIPRDDPFVFPWEKLREAIASRGLATIEVSEHADSLECDGSSALALQSLDAFRPIVERAPELQVAEAQRREFFAQLHRWMRQNYAVRVFCNTQGERERFEEIWREYGFDVRPALHLGILARGFIFDAAKLVVVTD